MGVADFYINIFNCLGENMKILIPDTMLVNGKEIKIRKRENTKPPIINSTTIPKFIQDERGTWVKNPKHKGE